MASPWGWALLAGTNRMESGGKACFLKVVAGIGIWVGTGESRFKKCFNAHPFGTSQKCHQSYGIPSGVKHAFKNGRRDLGGGTGESRFNECFNAHPIIATP